MELQVLNNVVDEIINNIKNNIIADNDCFEIAQLSNNLLSSNDLNENELGRKIIIYIIDNWHNLSVEYHKIFTDLISKCGFYPYLEKEKEKIMFDNLKSEVIKELHKAEYINNDNLYFHSAQKELRDILINTEQNIVVSAPTSFGKSLLIEEVVASQKYKNIIIIQPTLALLNETRNSLRKYDDFYKIIIRVSDKPSEEKGNIFLLTAERVMEHQNLPKIDFFILDEFYKISQKRYDERYEVLNNACIKMLNRHNARFYFLGPNIDEVSAEFLDKYNAVFKKYNYALVVNEEIEIKTEDKYYPDRSVELKEQRLFEELLSKDEQTIIYCSSPEKSIQTAINFVKYIDSLESSITQNSETNIPLIQWIKEQISYKWELCKCLKYRIGVHNGAFPKHINAAVIDYFNRGDLLYLFCTSTIIEGVNTSTKNVIIYNNWRGKQTNKIDYFDYKNIKGRSGRMFQHYVGNLYNFYPKMEEEKIIVDIPFVDQENPLNKEILAQTEEENIKNKDSKEYKELKSIPKEELELFKKNGLSIDGQKAILEHLKNNFSQDYNLFAWTYMPKYKQSLYILALCFKHLTKVGETGGNVSPEKLSTLITKCNMCKNLYAIVQNEINYLYEKLGVDYTTALTRGFQIQRHWFDYKLPKWFGCFNELQKYVCKLNGVNPGNYSVFLAQLENDYMSSRANLLMEFDLPISAIRKLDSTIPAHVNEQDVVAYVKRNKEILNFAELTNYEKERITKEIL